MSVSLSVRVKQQLVSQRVQFVIFSTEKFYYISVEKIQIVLMHSFSNLSDDRSNASSKTVPPHSAI
jgi:hypothetical protein